MDLTSTLTIFVLSMFLGWELITKVPPTLHTPLMSGSNAISGITLIGALIGGSTGHSSLATLLALAAVFFATINVVGGFLVTQRMLAMFRSKGRSSSTTYHAKILYKFSIEGTTFNGDRVARSGRG